MVRKAILLCIVVIQRQVPDLVKIGLIRQSWKLSISRIFYYLKFDCTFRGAVFIGVKMNLYTIDELQQKIRLLDERIENAQSQVSFNGRSVSYQVAELTKQRDRYQQMLDEQLAQSGQRAKKHRIKYARFI